jgi:alpha-amylase
MTPSEIAETIQPVAAINIPSPISWADEERDITAWLGNELQAAALDKLYELADKVKRCNDQQMNLDWEYLQSSDHFYYMATKFFSDGAVHAYFNPYETPYDAFMNYMNVLSDFEIRVNRCLPDTNEQIQISRLDNLLHEKDRLIEKQAAEISSLSKKKVQGDLEADTSVKGYSPSMKDLAHMLKTSSTSGKKVKVAKTPAPEKTSGEKAEKKPAAKKKPAAGKKTKAVKKSKK